jgi:hypothetical protein
MRYANGRLGVWPRRPPVGPRFPRLESDITGFGVANQNAVYPYYPRGVRRDAGQRWL